MRKLLSFGKNEGRVLHHRKPQFAPCYFEGTHSFRHPGYNVAHFNIDERAGILSNGELRMFHYTMLHQFQWNVASYAETLRQKENPALMRARESLC